MDTPATLLKPRLRLFRRSPSPRDPDAAPQPGPHHDDESDEFPTPRIHPRPIVVDQAAAETPAARLRALLAREPRSPRATTPPAPPSEADSTAGPPRFGSSTSSVARDSLKDIFSRALREPGDTPQKGRPRSNSLDGSSMEITPVANRDRGRSHRRAIRRSLSDEEGDNPKFGRRADPSFRLSTALTFDALRARLASSRSQLMNQNPPEALYDHSSLASAAASNPQHQPQASTGVNPQVSSLTPHPSFQMSSQLGYQSNLLEQDSDMQRAMGDVLSSENEASATAPNPAPSESRPSSSLRRSQNGSKLEHRHPSYELDSSTSSSLNGANGREHRFHSQEEDHNHQREREWNRPRLPSGSGTPEVHRRHSQDFHRRLSHGSPSHTKSVSHDAIMSQTGTAKPAHRHLQRRGSLASLRSFDDDHSSVGSQADYRDRISELDREKNHEREREWNKRHPPSRPSSSLSTSSSHSFSHSHPPRSPSAIPPTHASLQRRPSRTSLRSDSPASLASSRDSLKEREEEETKEVIHERERNWNSPRPHWLASKTSPASHLKVRSKDNGPLRGSSSLPHLRDSNRHSDTSRPSAKVASSSTSPALLHKSGGRSSSDLETSGPGVVQSPHSSPSKTPGAASRFGWNFARSPLPPLELDDTGDRRRGTSSPTPGTRLSGRASEPTVSNQIPVRPVMKSFSSVGHATSDMSLTNVVDDESSFQQDYHNNSSDLVEPHDYGEPSADRTSWSQEDMAPASQEASVVDFPPQSTTPKSNPPKPTAAEIETDTDTEVLTSPSPQGSPQLGVLPSIPDEEYHQNLEDPLRAQTANLSLGEPPATGTPPGTPPATSPRSQLPTSEEPPSFALATPPRGSSFGSSIMDFRTPSPPHDLPDLPGPPSSSDEGGLENSPLRDRRDDVNFNSTLIKTPKPPGAWAPTPLPPKFGHRPSSPTAFFPLDSTPPASTSTPLPRTNSLPPTRTDAAINDSGEDELLTPIVTLSRAKSLPLRTPLPPGGWVATPGQSALLNNGDQSQYGSLGRRKGLLKVRFDVTESETSATEGHPNSPLSAIRLSNPELPLPTTDHGAHSGVKVVENEGALLTVPAVSHRPATPERPTTPISRENGPSPRSLRKSPSVRVVDAFGRERVDQEGTELSIDLPNGHANVERKKTPSPPTPRRSLVRIVDAMGREVDDTLEVPESLEDRANRLFEADVSVVSDGSPIGHAEALVRMRKTLRDLAESLSDADRSDDVDLNSSHLEQLEEVSQAARLVRNQLAHNLDLEAEKQHDLHQDNKSSVRSHGLLPETPKRSWNTTVIYCGIVIQLVLILVMWRYAHTEARRLFYTTYYDPLYPELTPIEESSCFNGMLSTSRPWTMLDSYEAIRQEGWWSIRKEIFRGIGHLADQAWERWGENVHFEKPT